MVMIQFYGKQTKETCNQNQSRQNKEQDYNNKYLPKPNQSAAEKQTSPKSFSRSSTLLEGSECSTPELFVLYN